MFYKHPCLYVSTHIHVHAELVCYFCLIFYLSGLLKLHLIAFLGIFLFWILELSGSGNELPAQLHADDSTP